MFDVDDRDLPVPISGNWVIKGCMTKWLRFYVFNVFFENPNNMTFYVFWDVAHVFSNTGFDVNKFL